MPYGGGFATRRFSVTDTMQVTGQLTCKLCYSQMPTLLALGLTRVNSSQTSPWTTTEPVGDLASVTIDHAVFYSDTGTYKRRRYLGVKCTSGRFEISRESKVGTLTLQLQASTPQGNHFDGSQDPNSTVFPVPADSDYPTDLVLFSHSAGNLTLGASQTQYDSLAFDWDNQIDARYFASNFVQVMRSFGRMLHVESDLVYNSTPDYRSDYEALTALAMEAEFSNGTHTATLNFNTNARISTLTDDLALDKIYYRKLQGLSGFDPNAGSDFSFSFS